MKHPLLLFALLLGQLCLVACRKTDAPGGCSPLTDQQIYPQDSVYALSAQLDDDCLELTVSYGGGCMQHDFELYWEGTLLESKPPQAALLLLHDSHHDSCEALQTIKMSVDLSRVQAASNGEVILRVIATGVEPIKLSY